MLLLTSAFSLSVVLGTWYENWKGNRSDKSNALTVLMGDSRRIFADHFIAKADVYFHSGYYPSIFDAPKERERSHMEENLAGTGPEEGEEHHEHDENCNHGEENEEHGEADLQKKPRDVIEAFGRIVTVTTHTHLTEGAQREMLPWLKVAAELDPQKVQTYTVASYWLRNKLNKPKEAEQFLREGLRANPESYEILFELGRIQREHYSKPDYARNLWELALAKWKKQEAAGLKPNEFNYEQILGFLGALEEEQGNVTKAIDYFEMLKEISPAKEAVAKRIADLKAATVAQ